MLSWLITSGLRLRGLVVAAAIGILGVGLVQLHGARVDVYPEFTQPAVRVQAEALGLSAQEVEQLITVPLEQDLLNGTPWVKSIRSKSMPGLCAIDLVFDPGTDLYRARQMVQERMTQAKVLPNVGTPPIMVQPLASTSRIAMIGLTSKAVTTMQMSVLARWQIRPRLMSIPGVANVSIWGQRDRQLQVQVDPKRLQARKVTLTQLIESTGNALWVSPLSFVEASTPGTGGFVESPNQRLGVQHISPVSTSKQLADVAVEGVTGAPMRIGDVADVREDHQPLIGDATVDGQQQSLMLVVERFPDANTAKVTRDVESALAAMAPGLSGITVNSQLFRPATYLETAQNHLGVAALTGFLLLLVVLGVLLMSWRMVLIAAVSVPLSLTAAAYVLYLRGTTLTTLTLLGFAIALAVVVDDAVGDVQEICRQLRQERDVGGEPPAMAVTRAVVARRGPLLYAMLVALLAAAPLLLLSGVAGKFAPSVLASYALAILASLVVALFVTPILAVLLLGGRSRPRTSLIADRIQRSFDRVVAPSLNRPVRGLVAAAVLLLLGLSVVPQLKSGAVLPDLQDRDVLVRLQAAPGMALPETRRVTDAVTAEIRNLAGVEATGSHVGRAVGADEIVDVNASEIWVKVAPDADYVRMMNALRTTVRGYPGLRTAVSTYPASRVAAADSTNRKDLVVRVYGPDFATLRNTADDVSRVLATVEGVLSPRVASQPSQPTVEVEVNLVAAQRHGLRPGDVRREASTLISGLTVGSLYEQQKIFDVVVWGGPAARQSVSSLEGLLIDTPSGEHVPLGDVARVRIAANPVVITHDAVSRSLDVSATVRGRDAGSVAREVTGRLHALRLPYEYRAEVLGDAATRTAARQRIAVAAIVVAMLILLLLQAATGSWRGAAVTFLTVPLGVVGAVLAAPLVGGIRSVGAFAGVFAVFALAVRQSLVLVRRAQVLGGQECSGAPHPAAEAVRRSAREMVPPVTFAAVATAAVLLPAAVMGSPAGLEILHPFAVTVLAGLVSSTVVVLFVVPVLYLAWAGVGPRPVKATAGDLDEGGQR